MLKIFFKYKQFIKATLDIGSFFFLKKRFHLGVVLVCYSLRVESEEKFLEDNFLFSPYMGP